MIHSVNRLTLIRRCLTDSTQKFTIRSVMSYLMSIVREEHIVVISGEVIHIVNMSEVEKINLSLTARLASTSMLIVKPSH